jgi:hypothetical protein
MMLKDGIATVKVHANDAAAVLALDGKMCKGSALSVMKNEQVAGEVFIKISRMNTTTASA